MMYEELKLYRFHVNIDGFTSVFTGEVIQEDEASIKISTIKNEIIIIKKSNIDRAKMIGDDNEYRYK